MSEEKVGASFIGQIYDIRTKRDGGGRIQIDFGADALEEIQFAQKFASTTGCSFQIALVPLRQSMIHSNEEFKVDENTGEVRIMDGNT